MLSRTIAVYLCHKGETLNASSLPSIHPPNMLLRDNTDMDRETISDFAWKWRCKLFPVKDATFSKRAAKSGKDGAATDGADGNDKDPNFGASPIIKTLYDKNTSDLHARHEWVDYPPKQMSKSAARAQDRVAIKVYKVRDHRKPCISGRVPLKYFKIEVQNPTLVAALAPIVKKENCHLDVNEAASFEEPFRSLWFCQDDIKELYKKTDASEPLKSYLKLFIQVLDDLFREMTIKRRNIQTSRLVDFKTAWTLFPRGSTVYSFGINAEFLAKVEGTAYVSSASGNALQIKVKILKFNGEKFVWQERVLPIGEFDGNKPILELGHYPLEFHQDAQDIKRRLTIRGRKVLDLQGLEYRLYNGIALYDGRGCIEKHNVEGRILLDAVGYNKYHLTQGKRENDKRAHVNNDQSRNWNPYDEDSSTSSDSDTDSPDNELEKRAAAVRRLGEEEFQKNKQYMESRAEDICFISAMLGGYALKNKMWSK